MTKSKVVLSLDVQQLRLLHEGLVCLSRNTPGITTDPPERPHMFSQLCGIVLTAHELCENRDRAIDAEAKLYGLLAERPQ